MHSEADLGVFTNFVLLLFFVLYECVLGYPGCVGFGVCGVGVFIFIYIFNNS